jgi:ribosomal protein S18 acetylase RimI-like enzyme
MPLHYRTARVDDLERAQALVVSSINDLTERHGFGPMAGVRPPYFQTFSLKDDPDGLWVAEEGNDIKGFAFSWVCDDLWFLAELFVSPDQQGRGIGNELLRRTLQHAEKVGATDKALITFTFNRASQALYIRHGMYPRTPIYFFNVARDSLADLPDEALRSVTLEDTAANLERLDRIDRQALGVSRRKHHQFLMADASIQGALLHDRDECVGYTYVSTGGHVGPLAVTQRSALGPAFSSAVRLAAARGAAQVSAFLPGAAEAALSIAVQHGMRITFPMLLMSSREFGNWSQYLPRNPGFM